MEHQGSPLSFFKKFLFLKVILFFNYIGVKLTYNVVLVSGVKQSESVIYIHTQTHTHTHIYVYMHSISDSFPIQVITEY